jgi:hypothetical protein
MTEYLHRDRYLDNQAFAVVLSAVLVGMLLLSVATVVGETPSQAVAVATTPSQLQCTPL